MKTDKKQRDAQIRKLIGFVIRYKDKWTAAGLMLILGTGNIIGSCFYVPQPQAVPSVLEEAAPPVETTAWQTEPVKRIVEETTTAEKTWEPSLVELNLAHFFPEGADQNDITKSLAGEAFKVMMTHDEEWMSSIYDYADITPAQMASRLGKPVSSVRADFDPRDDRHDRNKPETWTVNSFKKVRITAVDGDGRAVSPYSNVLDIMSMANVFTYYKGVDDYELFLAYAEYLWEQSHSYSVSMSNVYYCSGCMSEDAQLREMEELEAEARAEAEAEAPGLAGGTLTDDSESSGEDSGQVNGAAEAGSAETTPVIVSGTRREPDNDTTAAEARTLEETADSRTPETAAATPETVPTTPETAASTPETNPTTPETAAATPEASPATPETSPATPETAGTVPASTSAVILAKNGARESSPAEEGAQETEAFQTVADGATQSHDGSTASDTVSTEAFAHQEGAASPSNSGRSLGRTQPSGSDQQELTDCPGHVDLIIRMKIIGLDETSNLFALDQIGTDQEKQEEGGWTGWEQKNKNAVHLLSNKDWFEKYGLTVSAISARNPLTSAEIEAYMTELPADLSQTRREIIRFALDSVGKVPYYWGGKASSPNYSGNHFGVFTTPDYKGRVLKGLDCSGWIGWVYWSATGTRLPYESTSGLAVCGTKIQRNELKPGDIVVRTGTDAHVIMFLGWTADGRIRCIHESSSSVNNVTVAVRDANWPYYRRLVD